MRAVYTSWIWEEQDAAGLPNLPPCTICGQPTGNWCDVCERLCSRRGHRTTGIWGDNRESFSALCTFCENDGHTCRKCEGQ